MPLPAPQTGPYTRDDLLALLGTILDPLYLQPLLEQGEGKGLEVFTQMIEQLVRVSEAVDRTAQAMFLKVWSGQSNPPALGGAQARVELRYERDGDGFFSTPVTITPDVLAEEETTDFSDAGSLVFDTGRRYIPLAQFTFLPGERGPFDVEAVAEKQGYGYNNPLPGTIKALVQLGAGLPNIRADIVPGAKTHRLVTFPAPDVVVPEHVGQYVQLFAGANAGAVRRVVGYEPPAPGNGGVALLAKTAVLRVSAVVGTFIVNEPVTVGVGVTVANFIDTRGIWMVLERVDGPILVGDTVTGDASGATATIDAVDQDPELVAETATAQWRVMHWSEFGLTATNPAGPTGGRAPMLDELGNERAIGRSPNESDDSYRDRVTNLPDVVSPNAIRRVCNRILAKYGFAVCLREVGSALLPGLYCDGDPLSADPSIAFAFDLDLVTITGAPVGTFFEGEQVQQIDGSGAIATGRMCMTPPPSPTVIGVANVRGTFVVGFPIIGLKSGASITPIALSGGLRPEDRFKLDLDYIDFRAFFLVGVPGLTLGEFGVGFDDAGGVNALDLSGEFFDFFDGFPATAAQVYTSIWNAVNKARAAGVGFELYVERLGCF